MDEASRTLHNIPSHPLLHISHKDFGVIVVIKTKTNEIDLTDGPLFSKLLAFAIPTMLSGLLQCLYNAADSIVVGRFAGDAPLAAVGATGALVNLIVNLFVGFSVGSSITAATSIGARNSERTQRILHSSIAIALVCGVVISLIGIIGAPCFLEIMDTPADIIEMSTLYLRIFFSGSIFSMIFNFGAAILRAAGDSKRPLIYLAISGIANVALNLVFVICFGMDVDGVALATVISQILSAVMVVIALYKNQGDCHLDFKKIRFHAQEVVAIIKTGLPAGVQSVVFALSNSIIQSTINTFDTIAVAGNAAASNIEGFIFTAMYSFHATAVTATGQNVGAKKISRINRILPICVSMSAATGLIMGALVTLFSEPLVSLYLPNSPESVIYGAARLQLISLTYFLCGVMDTIVGISRGMGNTVSPMIVSILGVCGIRLSWIFFIFPLAPTLTSLYLSYPVSWFVTGAVQLIMCLRVKKKLQIKYAE